MGIVSSLVGPTYCSHPMLIPHSGTSKHYSDYGLTNLGYDQAFNVGGFYRDTYVVDGAPRKILGISPEAYVTNQLYAAAPDQQVK